MVSERHDAGWLWDMLTAAQAVRDFVAARSFEDYEQDLMLRSAVERQIEIIGEAARRVSPAFRDAHPEIPWRPIMAQRYVLAHNYGEIRHELIWRVATQHIPALVRTLEPLIPERPAAGDEESDKLD
jgi:uncharacterized protein with HEPN domain